jgi:hypothetical protein
MLKPVLDPVAHARIILDKANICAMAGINPQFLEEGLSTYCTPAEVQWVREFIKSPKTSTYGLLLSGRKPDTRCQAIAACLVRYYIDARMMSLNELLERYEAHDLPTPTVLLVPNLFVSVSGKGLPGWKIQSLYDVLVRRRSQGRASIVYVEDKDSLALAYGTPFSDLLSNFKEIKA